MKSSHLDQHVRGTYHSLRLGVAIIGFLLPLLLGAWSTANGGGLEDSMSAYYYTPMRNVFVGALVAIGVSLVLYRGFSVAEDWALNVAGFFAVCVAFLPCFPAPTGGLHTLAAALFFACVGYVCVFRASDTLSLVRDAGRARKLRALYRSMGIAIILAPLLMWFTTDVFATEMTAVWIFSWYWLEKGREIRSTEADAAALRGALYRRAPSPEHIGRLVVTSPEEEVQGPVYA